MTEPGPRLNRGPRPNRSRSSKFPAQALPPTGEVVPVARAGYYSSRPPPGGTPCYAPATRSPGTPLAIEISSEFVTRCVPVAEDAVPPDAWVVPAFFDPQVNGALGVDFSDPATTPNQFRRVCEWLEAHGVSAFLPTVVTGPPGRTEAALDAIARRRGVGPFLRRPRRRNPPRRAIHQPARRLSGRAPGRALPRAGLGAVRPLPRRLRRPHPPGHPRPGTARRGRVRRVPDSVRRPRRHRPHRRRRGPDPRCGRRRGHALDAPGQRAGVPGSTGTTTRSGRNSPTTASPPASSPTGTTCRTTR